MKLKQKMLVKFSKIKNRAVEYILNSLEKYIVTTRLQHLEICQQMSKYQVFYDKQKSSDKSFRICKLSIKE